MNQEFLKERVPFKNMTFSATHLCNLNCSECYLPKREDYNPPLEDIEKMVFGFDGNWITLSGVEPTLRKDLIQIIKLILKHNKMLSLLTNGLKLADINYVKKLKNAGLTAIHFSFNAFTDDVLIKIDGARVLRQKLKALRNIKKEKILTCISVLLVKGVNEKEIKKIYRFCLRNNSFIKQLRIRRAIDYGKEYSEDNLYYLSEMIDMVSKVIGFDKKILINHYLAMETIKRFKEIPTGAAHCQLEIDLFGLINWFIRTAPLAKKIKKISSLILDFGLLNIVKIYLRKFLTSKKLYFHIFLRAYPDEYRIDLDDIFSCFTGYATTDSKILPYCYALVLNSKYSCI